MRVKTHSFDDIRKGMETIKETYGPDTIIVDIKHNNLNGHGWSKKSCEISVALNGNPELQENDLGELRKRTESIWNNAARSLSEKLMSLESEMIKDRVKAYPLPLKVLFDRIVKNGVNVYLAVSMISDVYCEIGQLAENSVKASFFLKDAIAKRIRVFDITDNDDPVMILGPTGAGKTETTKKLAKMISDRERHATIIAFDPIKRGSYDDFAAFSESTGIPFIFTTNIDDLCVKAGKSSGKRIIDITGHIDFQDRIVKRLPAMKKVIVIPAGARDEKMKYYLKKYQGSSNLAGIIFTKLDEEEHLGHLCHNLVDLDQPICSMTTGINLEDIVVPNHEIFGKIFLEGNPWRREERESLR